VVRFIVIILFEAFNWSLLHISKTSVDRLYTLVLLDMFTEGTVSLIHIGELVFVLDEEPIAVLTLGDGYFRRHIFEVAFWH